MMAVIRMSGDFALSAFCGVLALLAVGFFITIFVADFRESRRKAEARKALRRRSRDLH